MKSSRLPICVILFAVLILQLRAQDPAATDGGTPAAATSAGDVEAIRATGGSFVKAFNAHDAKAVAAHWTANGDYVDDDGQRYEGREALESEYAALFEAAPDARMLLTVESIRLINDHTAIEDGTVTLAPLPAGPPGSSRYTAVHVKQDGKWLMASVRDSRIEIESQYAHLADLEWLIGQWGTEHEGQELHVAVTWLGNKNFIKRELTHKHGDQVVASSLEIIGYDPLTESVKSWTFTSDGGHAVGAWSAHQSGWYVETSGVTADGTQTSSVDELARLDDDTMSWRSVDRSKGDVNLPDLSAVILKRK